MLFAHPAVKGLMLGVRVNVDQPRQYEAILAVDHAVYRPGIISPDKSDRIVGKGDVGVAAVGVMPRVFVPGDDPIGIADDGGYQCSIVLIGPETVAPPGA